MGPPRIAPKGSLNVGNASRAYRGPDRRVWVDRRPGEHGYLQRTALALGLRTAAPRSVTQRTRQSGRPRCRARPRTRSRRSRANRIRAGPTADARGGRRDPTRNGEIVLR